MVDFEKLDALVFYAVDKASPRNLQLEPGTTLDSIEKIYLDELGITGEGRRIMWLVINSEAYAYAGAHPVPAAAQAKCDTVSDVRKAAHEAAKTVDTAREFL